MPPQDVWKFTSVLQDIDPLGPYSHSTSSLDHSEQGVGRRVSLTICDPWISSFVLLLVFQ